MLTRATRELVHRLIESQAPVEYVQAAVRLAEVEAAGSDIGGVSLPPRRYQEDEPTASETAAARTIVG